MTPSIVSTRDGTRITIHVIPNAKETKVLERDGSITMRVHVPPANRKANREIVGWLSKKLGKPSSQVGIVAGTRSRMKFVEIIGTREKDFLEAIGNER